MHLPACVLCLTFALPLASLTSTRFVALVMGNTTGNRPTSDTEGHASPTCTDHSKIPSSKERTALLSLFQGYQMYSARDLGVRDGNVFEISTAKDTHNLGRSPPSSRGASLRCHAVRRSSDISTVPAEHRLPRTTSTTLTNYRCSRITPAATRICAREACCVSHNNDLATPWVCTPASTKITYGTDSPPHIISAFPTPHS